MSSFAVSCFIRCCLTASTASATSASWPTAIALPSSPFAANFSIMSEQPQTMASRRLWIRRLKPGPRFLPVPIVVASCASLSAFDIASDAPALEHHRSDATHREPSHVVHDDHHSSFRSQRLDHRGRCRIRAVTLRDNNRPMQQKAYRDLRRSASDLNSSRMRTPVSLPHAPSQQIGHGDLEQSP
ncbi:hypothetical protein ACVWY2_001977 [Bradyrhizobium sp. JR6.1]